MEEVGLSGVSPVDSHDCQRLACEPHPPHSYVDSGQDF